MDMDRVEIQCVLLTLTKVFPKPGLFEASKGSRHIRFVVGVDEHGSRLQPLTHVHGLVNVTGEDSRGQAELCVICSAQHSIYITGISRETHLFSDKIWHSIIYVTKE